MNYQLPREIWTADDFEEMAWHDCVIHAISFKSDFKLLFDIDYIFEWVLVGKKYKFWIAPCTLIFENCYDVNFDLDMSTPGLEIDCLTRKNPKKPSNAEYIEKQMEFDWFMDTQQGTISFTSVDFSLFVRRKPVYSSAQSFDLEARGGISFDLTAI
ncbi:MAG TPA: hypothetical protein VHE34_10600 [Puia sp.]|uniref:hypothetical protein n=1 Tax=Puia sp. TaxID=2045100 RepID=UPI002CC6E64C|nr:hypothetical protein [Puia sp.]HVU95666.1 hypothetical protein [Puia sp.]